MITNTIPGNKKTNILSQFGKDVVVKSDYTPLPENKKIREEDFDLRLCHFVGSRPIDKPDFWSIYLSYRNLWEGEVYNPSRNGWIYSDQQLFDLIKYAVTLEK